ncbi:hypothetical protein, partial [Streptomyces diastaticus]
QAFHKVVFLIKSPQKQIWAFSEVFLISSLMLVLIKNPEEPKLKIETLSEAKKKMKELLSDPQLNLPRHYPERSLKGIILLDQNNELHKELK